MRHSQSHPVGNQPRLAFIICGTHKGDKEKDDSITFTILLDQMASMNLRIGHSREGWAGQASKTHPQKSGQIAFRYTI
jgi:hypothetical protein